MKSKEKQIEQLYWERNLFFFILLGQYLFLVGLFVSRKLDWIGWLLFFVIEVIINLVALIIISIIRKKG